MEFRIADAFTESLARLTAQEQKAARTIQEARNGMEVRERYNLDISRPFPKSERAR